MSFYTSLSGLNAATTDLNVTSNNIANVGTTGFKSSRAEFGDLISASAFQSANSVIGQGTKLKSISQEFSQGSSQTTSRALDLMIGGQGFFVTKASGTGAQVSFTRSGSFSVDGNNNVVDSNGNQLQVLPVDPLGNVTATGLAATQSLHVPATNGAPKASSTLGLAVSLPADADVPSTRDNYDATTNPYAFNVKDANSYNYATSTTAYDSAGNAVPATVYYVHTEKPTTNADGTKSGNSVWQAHTFIGDKEITPTSTTGTAPQIVFDSNGALVTTAANPGDPVTTASGTYEAKQPTGASAPISLTVDYTGTKEGSYAFAATATQNGHTTGKLDNLAVDSSGLISASYSDGTTLALGKVAVANFVNPDGLHQVGNTTWTQTGNSGSPEIGEANTDGRGSISSGQLEMSNVDLSAELVNLISAQRNFQANAKAIDTDKQMLQSIIQVIG